MNRERTRQKRKYFYCKIFGHIACNCKNRESRGKKRSTQRPSNKFEVLARRLMNEEDQIRKNRRRIRS